MPDYAPVKLKPCLIQSFCAPRVAGIQHRHVVFFSQHVDSMEQRTEIFIRVHIFLTVGRQQDIISGCKPQPL